MGAALLASAPCAAQNAKIDPPLMGWSSWNTYRVNINQQLIEKQADALVAQGLKEAGYLYINVDDGFFGHRDATGEMHAHPTRFPNGMKVVADYIHSLGLRAGIYSDAGGNTCGSIWDNDANGVGAGLYGHERQDIDLYLKRWGYDFIKIDYCGGQELGLDEERRYEAIHQAILATGRHDVSINICRWAFPGTWARRMARSWRVSSDINPSWKSVKYIIDKNLYLSAYAGGGHYNDMDMLEIGRGLAPNEEEVHFGMWCIMSSPLLIGCDLTTIPPSSLTLLKNEELIALNQDPLGLQAYVAARQGKGYALVKDIGSKRGLTRAVALYNPSDSACRFSVPLSQLELGGKVTARDLIHHQELGDLGHTITRMVPPRSVLIWKLTAEQRLEPTSYEAEWAYLPCYDDLGKNPKQIHYERSAGSSGGIKVANVGGKPENYVEWPEVYSQKGGRYTLTVSYGCDKPRRLEVTVNGERQAAVDNLDSKGSIDTVTVPINLRPGYNQVRLGNNYGWAPDIDRIRIAAPDSHNRKGEIRE
ncbi:MAG: alpha-galactosidase [Mediterranea sp.]|jgi:hypothetical protein|nr:alpha-galactosidase [Mediterranea sp.]